MHFLGLGHALCVRYTTHPIYICYIDVPFVKPPFEWEIRGGANLATFCCVLLVTWCHRVCFSCCLRQNGATINMSRFKVLTSRLFPHIWCCSVEFGANSPKFTQDSHKIHTHSRWRICPTLHRFASLQLSSPFVISICRKCFRNWRPCSPGLMLLPTPWRNTKPSLSVAHHQIEEATYNSGALTVEEVVAWAASLDPAPEVIHIDLRSPSRNSHLGGKAWTNLVHTPPPHCDMVCLQDLAAGSPPNHSFSPFSWHFANPRWWEDPGIAPFHPTVQPKVHIPDIAHPTFYSTTALQWFRGSSCAPPLISSEPRLRTEPLPEPPLGMMCDSPADPNSAGPSQPPPHLCSWERLHCASGGGGCKRIAKWGGAR